MSTLQEKIEKSIFDNILNYCLETPNKKILVCSPSFRQTKDLLEKIEKTLTDNYKLFTISKGTDRWTINFGTSQIVGAPLNEKIRGFKFDVLFLQECRELSQKEINELIIPSISSGQASCVLNF